MNCIIIDDEPLARESVELLIKEDSRLSLIGHFSNAVVASSFMANNVIDLIFLDVQMPYINGIEFAKTISRNTLVIFTTAYSEYALDGYEVDAIDYLVKPIDIERFSKAVDKAIAYHSLLLNAEEENVENIGDDFIFVKSERRFQKVYYRDILFVEGLKDYVVIQTSSSKIITKMSLKTMIELIPQSIFFRVNRSYIINLQQIDSFDNNDVFIRGFEISIGNNYRESFFSKIKPNKLT